mmetsp:Transcript_50597/g.122096  ORF Transcript_50597/g.122096 Transcript_50597/m.122096 type:complete len:208 (+) Transcript_50597:253-876(+)
MTKMYKYQKATMSFVDDAPVRTSVAVKLKALPHQVFDVLVDYPNWTRWFPDVKQCYETSSTTSSRSDSNHTTTTTMSKVGTIRHIEVGPLIAEEEIIAFDDGSGSGSADGRRKTTTSKIFAFTILESNQNFTNCWVEMVKLEPIWNETASDVVGSKATYSTGLRLCGFLYNCLSFFITESLKKNWRVGLSNIDDYIESSQRDLTFKG